MNEKRVFKSISMAGCFAFTIGTMSLIAPGQKGGTAAKGGSLRVEKPQRNSKTLGERMGYRRIVYVLERQRDLKLDFAELKELHQSALDKGNVRLKFETVIKASLAAQRHSNDDQFVNTQKVVDALSSTNNNLAAALQRVFSISEREAKAEEVAVTAHYKEAERDAARSVQ